MFGNRRGPFNEGPGTGRGLGFCSGYSEPGSFKNGFGRGMGMHRGKGFSHHPHPYFHNYNNTGRFRGIERISPEEEKDILENRKESLNREMEFLNQRIQEIETKQSGNNKE